MLSAYARHYERFVPQAPSGVRTRLRHPAVRGRHRRTRVGRARRAEEAQRSAPEHYVRSARAHAAPDHVRLAVHPRGRRPFSDSGAPGATRPRRRPRTSAAEEGGRQEELHDHGHDQGRRPDGNPPPGRDLRPGRQRPHHRGKGNDVIYGDSGDDVVRAATAPTSCWGAPGTTGSWAAGGTTGCRATRQRHPARSGRPGPAMGRRRPRPPVRQRRQRLHRRLRGRTKDRLNGGRGRDRARSGPDDEVRSVERELHRLPKPRSGPTNTTSPLGRRRRCDRQVKHRERMERGADPKARNGNAYRP